MKYIIGNWKMNGSRQALDQMLKDLASIKTENRVVLCVPFTMLNPGNDIAKIGAQDVSMHERGAYTGEVSAAMIRETGAKYVIVGHSERRAYHDETNDIVRAKAERAIEAGLIPIICVGETMDEKKSGKTFEIIETGVRESVPVDTDGDIIVAYEPRWAIGAGITPTPQEIADAHRVIAETLSYMGRGGTPILYGASVNAGNIADIVAIPNVDGALIGGASLKPQDLIPIINIAK